MEITKTVKSVHIVTKGILTLESVIAVLPLVAFPVKVATDFLSSQYFSRIKSPIEITRRTTAIAVAPDLS